MLNLFLNRHKKNNNWKSEIVLEKITKDLFSCDSMTECEKFEKDFNEKNKRNDNLKRINEVRKRIKRDNTQ